MIDIQLEPYRTDVYQFTESVFISMLGVDVQQGDTDLPPIELISGAIYYAGPWKGAALLQCDPQAAYEFTSRLMNVPPPASFDDDVRDAIGEITNIIAGNLKPLLPHGVVLSMPSVVQGPPSALRICGDAPLLRLPFTSAAGPFWVTIVGLSEDPS